MTTRPPDFKASGIRTERLIACGSVSPRLLITGYDSIRDEGVILDSGTGSIKLTGTGSDTWLFISGSIGTDPMGGADRVTFGGDVYISGSLFGVSTGGGAGNWNELAPSPRINTTASVAIAGGFGSSYAAQSRGSDVFFFVSGTKGGSPLSDKVSVFGGDLRVSGVLAVEYGPSVFSSDVVMSGSVVLGDDTSDRLTVNSLLSSDIVPDGDRTRNLGSSSSRFANVYTGDLHLRNDRGDWTIIEEEDFLRVVNNKTGKSYRMMMEPVE